MSDDQTPKNDGAQETPETVDAEIVEPGETAETHLEGETIEDSQTTSSDEEKKGPGLVTPGVFLLGILFLGLIIIFLQNGRKEQTEPELASSRIAEEMEVETESSLLDTAGPNASADAEVKAVAATEARQAGPTEAVVAESEGAAALTMKSDAENSERVVAEADETKNGVIEDETASVESAEAVVAELANDAADAVSETGQAVAAVVEEEVTAASEAVEQGTIVEKTPEQRRREAIERARERRRIRDNAVSEVGAEEAVDAEVQTASAAEEPSSGDAVADASENTVIESTPADSAGGEEAATENATSQEAVLVAAGIAESALGDDPEIVTSAEAAGSENVLAIETDLVDKIENIKSDVKADLLAEAEAARKADQERLSRQEEEISDLKKQLDTAIAEQDKKAEQLEARLNDLQNRDLVTATKQAAVSIALTNLQRQMSTGRPFSEQLSILEELSVTTPALRELKAYSEDGLPTLIYLQRSYSDVARKSLAAAKRSNSDGPLARFGANLAGLFSIRKTGMVGGDSPSAIISRAEVSLEEGDVYTALKELGTLEGDSLIAMEAWINDARSYVIADQLMDDIGNRVVADL